MEATEDLSHSVILPLILSSINDEEQALPPVMAGQSKNLAASFFETARRYSSRIPALMEATGFEMPQEMQNVGSDRFERYGTDAFPALTDDYVAQNGLVVRPMRDFDMMRLETARLFHCVGQIYLGRARTCQSHLFSVQDQSGSISYSTLEVAGIRDIGSRGAALGLRSVQHRALRNGHPPAEALAAVEEWFKKVKEGEISIAYDEIIAWRKHLKESGEPGTQTI